MDWMKINALLGVIHSATAAGPKFIKYAQAAADELEEEWNTAPEVGEDDEPAKTATGRRV